MADSIGKKPSGSEKRALETPIGSDKISVLEDFASSDDLPLQFNSDDSPEDEPELVDPDTLPDDRWFFKGKLLSFPQAALFGVTGDIIRKLHPQTESHPAGNLVDLLISLGSIVGPKPFYLIEDSEHHCNEFGVRVGKSSQSRKGTGGNRIRKIVEKVDSNWCVNQNAGGLGSGEAVINRIRDDRHFTDQKGQSKLDPGVRDKRLHISEGEFANVLLTMNKRDSKLSVVFRDGWDSKPLRNETKGGGAQTCQHPHMSVMADCTGVDLLGLTFDRDKQNGAINRFLWVLVERTRMLPHGGDELDWSDELVRLHRVVGTAKGIGRVFMTRAARQHWTRQYPKLTADVPGVVGAVVARSAAHCIRLALLYALLDENAYEPKRVLSDESGPHTDGHLVHIDVCHLKAAIALWNYCSDSARIIFGNMTESQDEILAFISATPSSASEVRDVLYKRNRRINEIQSDLDHLVNIKKAVVDPAGRYAKSQ